MWSSLARRVASRTAKPRMTTPPDETMISVRRLLAASFERRCTSTSSRTTTTTTTTTTKKRDDGQNGGGWWSRRRPEENYASERSENGGVFVPRGESGNESAERSDGDHRNSRYRRRSGVDTAHWSDERVHRAIIYDLYSFTYVPQIPSSLENETVFFAVVVVSSTRERRLHTIPRFLVRRRNVFSKVVDVCVRIFWWPSPFRVALFRRPQPKSKNQKLFVVYPSPLHLCLGSY